MTEEAPQLPVKATNEPEPVQQPAESTVKVPKVWPLWLMIFLLLLIIAGGSAGAWLYLQSWQSSLNQNLENWQTRLDQAISQSEASNRILNQSGQRYETRMGQIDDAIAKNSSEVSDIRKLLDQTARRILTVGETGRTDWLLAEAEYLLRLANQRLHMEQDYQGSLAILKAADEVLFEAKDAATIPIRKSLSEEIESLNAIADIDRQGIYFKLEAMIKQLEKLDDSLFFEDAPLLNETLAGEDRTEQMAWYDDVLSTVKEHFVIRRLDHKVKPLPAPNQIYYLKQNLRLMLEQTQLALLEQKPEIYQQSLTKAEQWVQDYFLPREPATQALLKNLQVLKEKQVSPPPLPDISGSLRQLRNLIESVYKKGAQRKTTGFQTNSKDLS